jgi:hypothetical protein
MYQKLSLKTLLLSVATVTGIFPFFAEAKTCIKQFLIFDVGSSTTKSILYTKDLCKNNATIKRDFLNQNYPYQACLNNSKDQNLSQPCLIGGAKILSSIKEHFNLCKEKNQCFALATGWARTTNNINHWSHEVAKLNIKPIVVTQDYEGELKLKAIADHLKSEEKFLAFDIGGGSFQITWMDGSKQKYNSAFGTDNFAHKLQETFLNKEDLACLTARNQLILAKKGGGELDQATAAEKATCTSKSLATTKEEDYEKMLLWADEIIGKPLRDNKALQSFIDTNKPKFYADSLLFTLGIKEQLELGKDQVTLEDLEKLLKTFSSKTSDDIHTLYPKLPDICLYSTQASLVILYTILKNLNLPAFELVQTDYMESFLDTALNQIDKKG